MLAVRITGKCDRAWPSRNSSPARSPTDCLHPCPRPVHLSASPGTRTTPNRVQLRRDEPGRDRLPGDHGRRNLHLGQELGCRGIRADRVRLQRGLLAGADRPRHIRGDRGARAGAPSPADPARGQPCPGGQGALRAEPVRRPGPAREPDAGVGDRPDGADALRIALDHDGAGARLRLSRYRADGAGGGVALHPNAGLCRRGLVVRRRFPADRLGAGLAGARRGVRDRPGLVLLRAAVRDAPAGAGPAVPQRVSPPGPFGLPDPGRADGDRIGRPDHGRPAEPVGRHRELRR